MPVAPDADASSKIADIPTDASYWSLQANTSAIDDAATQWYLMSDAVQTARLMPEDMMSELVRDGWAGNACDTYQDHVTKLGNEVSSAVGAAREVGDALRAVSATLSSAQNSLDDLLVMLPVKRTVHADGGYIFHPANQTEADMVNATVGDALQVGKEADEVLVDQWIKIQKASSALSDAGAWATKLMASGQAGWQPLAEPKSTTFVPTSDGLLIDTGTGNDTVKISVNADGLQVVTIGKKTYTFLPGTHLTVRGGAGKDKITVADGDKLNYTLLGSSGDDTLTGGAGEDTIFGGAGADYIEGGEGNDRLAGGSGNDVIYGMAGNDIISGGAGNDYEDGATGKDKISGGQGDDIVSGGQGDDSLDGGFDDDKVYAGAGMDKVDGGGHSFLEDAVGDTVFAQPGDQVSNADQQVNVPLTDDGKAATIKVEGSSEFQARVHADLDTLRSSPAGQKILASLDHVHDETRPDVADWPGVGSLAYQGDTFTIKEVHPPHLDGADGNSSGTASSSPLSPDPIFGRQPVKGALSNPDKQNPIIWYDSTNQEYRNEPAVNELASNLAIADGWANNTAPTSEKLDKEMGLPPTD